ncbi:MAG: cytochrome b-c1 complex subunit 8 [Lentinula lateritia]|nr:MAG: cytochrome b-c1 complex subunit 8 [Lentinula lateritia]
MRPSIARASEMPGPKRAWSSWWGAPIIKQKGIVEYTLSPYQTKAAPHWVRNYVFNFYRRVSAEAVYFVIPFVRQTLGYGIYAWAKRHDAYQNSKAGHIASGAAHH